MVEVFGREFSGALALGALSLRVPPAWVCDVLTLEGDGMNPYASNASGARSMWQRMPSQVYKTGAPLIIGPDEPAPAGCILRNVRDNYGIITGHTVWKLYLVTDPVQQANDYFAWTRDRLKAVNAGVLKSREALYCCNLAPERLRDGAYDAETPLYSMRPEDGKAFYIAGYQQNAAAFGLDPHLVDGVLRMKHLATGLDAAVNRHRAKRDAELAAVLAIEAETYGQDAPPAPDMRDKWLSEVTFSGTEKPDT